MNIIVLLKTVKYVYAQTGAEISKNYISDDDIIHILNPLDEFAVEAALQLKDRYQDVHVLALSLGDQFAEDGLRKSLAMGADHAVHIYSNDYTGLDPWATATILSSHIRNKTYALILAGRQAIDDNAGLVGPYVAEQLGVPHVSSIVQLEPDEGLETISLHRAVERGNREIWKCKLPALFTIEKSSIIPRHPNLHGILRSKQQTIEQHAAGERDASPSSFGLDAGFKMTETIRLSNPKPKRKPGSRPAAALSAADRLKMMMNRGKTDDKEGKQVVAGNTEKALLETERLLEENGVFFE